MEHNTFSPSSDECGGLALTVLILHLQGTWRYCGPILRFSSQFLKHIFERLQNYAETRYPLLQCLLLFPFSFGVLMKDNALGLDSSAL